jgi:hypothetical protein
VAPSNHVSIIKKAKNVREIVHHLKKKDGKKQKSNKKKRK